MRIIKHKKSIGIKVADAEVLVANSELNCCNVHFSYNHLLLKNLRFLMQIFHAALIHLEATLKWDCYRN